MAGEELSLERVVSGVEASPLSGAELRRFAMELLSQVPGYDWCGVYRLEDGFLVLDEYVGAATDHDRIQVGVGVCGTAVAEDRNQIVADVHELENYLSCSVLTRSEIVVLIRRDGEVLGQIDVDGHEVGRFTAADEAKLERLARFLASKW